MKMKFIEIFLIDNGRITESMVDWSDTEIKNKLIDIQNGFNKDTF